MHFLISRPATQRLGPHNNVLMASQSAVGFFLTLRQPRQGGQSTTHQSKQGSAV